MVFKSNCEVVLIDFEIYLGGGWGRFIGLL